MWIKMQCPYEKYFLFIIHHSAFSIAYHTSFVFLFFAFEELRYALI